MDLWLDWVPKRRRAGQTCRRPWFDVSGVGVRTGIYSQATLVLGYGAYCIYLGSQERSRRHTWARKAVSDVTIGVLGLSLQSYAFAHAYIYGLVTYDAAVMVSLSLLMSSSCLLLAMSNWMLVPLDAGRDAAILPLSFVGALLMFVTSAVVVHVTMSSTPAVESIFCDHYGTEPSYVLPMQLSPRITQGFTIVFDVILDHLLAAVLPNVAWGFLGGAVSSWAEQGGIKVPQQWTDTHMKAHPLTPVSNAGLKLSGAAHIGLLWLCNWATKNIRRIAWSMAVCVLVCGTFMAGFAWWTEVVVAGIERPRGMTKEELWMQRLAFTILVLPAVRMIPHVWLVPYLKSLVRDESHARKHE